MSANIVTVDEESLRKDLGDLVRKTVQETINALLDEEADELVGAERTASSSNVTIGSDMALPPSVIDFDTQIIPKAGPCPFSVPRLCCFQSAQEILRYRLPDAALGEDPHQQRHRAAQPRDPQAHQGRGRVSRRQVGADAGDGEAEVHSGERVGREALPRRVPARGSGERDAGGRRAGGP